MIAASAPGKVILVGEYAVLDGAPALAMGVDRRVNAHWHPRKSGGIELDLPPLTDKPLTLPLGESDWTRAVGDHQSHLCSALGALQRLIEHGEPAWLAGPSTLHVDSRALYADTAAKLGLGSSAAVAAVVAGMAMRSRHGKAPAPADLHAVVRALPSHVQGSGLDLAAVIHGGVIEYRLGSASPHPPTWGAVPWPDSLSGLIVWSGETASSSNFVARYQAWKEAEPQAWSRQFRVLQQLAEASIKALKSSDIDGFIESLADYSQQTGTMGGLMGACIATPTHRQLASMARAHGVMYKPSGAGGGDIGVVLSTDIDATQAVKAAMADAGFWAMALTPSEDGLTFESKPQA